MGTETDEPHVEFLIQHCSIFEVLAFVVARDEVRRMAHEMPAVLSTDEQRTMTTIPMPGSPTCAARAA